jgi:hypothetical protein
VSSDDYEKLGEHVSSFHDHHRILVRVSYILRDPPGLRIIRARLSKLDLMHAGHLQDRVITNIGRVLIFVPECRDAYYVLCKDGGRCYAPGTLATIHGHEISLSI